MRHDAPTTDGTTRRTDAPHALACAFECAPDPVVLVDGHGIVVAWNRAAQRLFGWTARDMVGGPVAALVPPGEHEALRAAVDPVMLATATSPLPLSCLTKSGETVRALARFWSVVADDGDIIIAVTATDGDGSVCASTRVAAERFERIFADDALGVCCGVHDRVTEANHAFLSAVGSDHDGLRDGLALGNIFRVSSSQAPIVDSRGREFEVTRMDGTSAHVFAAVMSYGTDAGWVGLTVDVTERKAAERAVAHLALHDPVTGLPNSRLLLDAVEQALARAQRRSRSIALLFCDVDHFKRVNDTHGHRVGDEILRSVARRIESVLRGDDIVARVGGDEFVVVLQELADMTEATRVAERVRLAIADPVELEDTSRSVIHVTASIGAAISSPQHGSGELLLRQADDAMYIAKQQGRDQVSLADDSLQSPQTHSKGPER
jgi:diguanylate cyclase (GGDEF)-like protein/PAS domain S-box-containing protein